ncbi:RNA recognition motif-containing protein RRM [Tieghemostelium lacteum]|uniref:RNA recognition motif-containing protein RRM n=1 Tax=Tieghemostelium lacteum TaxID=361077 RepID=A0A151Z6Y3_TIELA|nr:RNA recognition motif-containing protein RRM [Tieghemostelium lacteum]|eukprot:KYQ89695.1 RNA recognition motif-containing protein RRM [Tieghemostelium lacteum]
MDDNIYQEKDQTNIFVKYLPNEFNDSDLYQLFSRFGNVLSSKVMIDPKGNSYGYGFVRFSNPEECANAIQVMDGYQYKNKKLLCRLSNIYSNLNIKNPSNNLFIKPLPIDVTDDKLRKIFSPFGEIAECKVMVDQNGQSKLAGFVRYSNEADATKAIQTMNGIKIGDTSPLVVKYADTEQQKSIRKQRKYLNYYNSTLLNQNFYNYIDQPPLPPNSYYPYSYGYGHPPPPHQQYGYPPPPVQQIHQIYSYVDNGSGQVQSQSTTTQQQSPPNPIYQPVFSNNYYDISQIHSIVNPQSPPTQPIQNNISPTNSESNLTLNNSSNNSNHIHTTKPQQPKSKKYTKKQALSQNSLQQVSLVNENAGESLSSSSSSIPPQSPISIPSSPINSPNRKTPNTISPITTLDTTSANLTPTISSTTLTQSFTNLNLNSNNSSQHQHQSHNSPLSSSTSSITSQSSTQSSTATSSYSDKNNLFVFHLPAFVDDNYLFQLFSPFGQLQSVRVIIDKDTGENKGYGFVKFVYREDAQKSLKEMNGFQIGQKYLKVKFKDSKIADQLMLSSNSSNSTLPTSTKGNNNTNTKNSEIKQQTKKK